MGAQLRDVLSAEQSAEVAEEDEDHDPVRIRHEIHRCRNLLAKVPKHAQDQLKADFWAIWDIATEAGDDAVAEARRRVKAF